MKLRTRLPSPCGPSAVNQPSSGGGAPRVGVSSRSWLVHQCAIRRAHIPIHVRLCRYVTASWAAPPPPVAGVARLDLVLADRAAEQHLERPARRLGIGGDDGAEMPG